MKQKSCERGHTHFRIGSFSKVFPRGRGARSCVLVYNTGHYSGNPSVPISPSSQTCTDRNTLI